MEDILDFREEVKIKEMESWSEEKKEEWYEKLTRDQKDILEKFEEPIEREKLNDYMEGLNFSLDSVYEIEREKDIFRDKEEIDKALKVQQLTKPIIGYAKLDISELGYTESIRNGGSINVSEVKKIISNLGDINLKRFGFTELTLSKGTIDKTNPILVEVVIPKGVDYGVISDKDIKNPALLLEKGLVLKPEAMNIINIKGVEYLLLKSSITKEVDFSNSNNSTWGEDRYSDLPSKLTSEQIEAVIGYVKQDYKDINAYLRFGTMPTGKTEAELSKQIKLISESLSKKPIDSDLILYRRVGQQMFGYNTLVTLDPPTGGYVQIKANEFIKNWTGKSIVDAGFMSTSLFSSNISAFANGIFILRLHVPKGSNAAYISQSNFQAPAGENEVLLDKNSTLTINKITTIKEPGLRNTSKTKFLIDATVTQNK